VVCPAATPTRVYRPRQPRASPLWQLLDRYFPQFQRLYDDRYQQRYGFWRPVIQRTVEKFLACGDLHEGFARVRCPRCRYEFFVAFSCRRRCLCPSCHQKRALLIAEHIARNVCEAVPHRQFVFTIPKRLRIFFRFDRRLLGALPRLAWQTVLEVYRAVLDRQDVVPGMIAAIHSHGQLLHWHPHLHALVSDGGFTPDGTFIPLPQLDGEPFETLWQQKVFDLLLQRGKINESLVQQMRSWHHSGFGVNFETRLEAHDVAGRERLAQYMLRGPFSLQRIIRVTEQGQVLYLAEQNAPQRFPQPGARTLLPGVARNFQVFDPLDFIAELTQHVPDPRKHLVRYCGFYSSKSRGMRARADGPQNTTVQIDDDHTPRPRLADCRPHPAHLAGRSPPLRIMQRRMPMVFIIGRRRSRSPTRLIRCSARRSRLCTLGVKGTRSTGSPFCPTARASVCRPRGPIIPSAQPQFQEGDTEPGRRRRPCAR
jgi:hypothetical protein